MGALLPPQENTVSEMGRRNYRGSWWAQVCAGNEQDASLVMCSACKGHRINCGHCGENELGMGPHRRWHCKPLKCCLAQGVKSSQHLWEHRSGCIFGLSAFAVDILVALHISSWKFKWNMPKPTFLLNWVLYFHHFSLCSKCLLAYVYKTGEEAKNVKSLFL